MKPTRFGFDTRYFGDRSKKEFHDSEHLSELCNVDALLTIGSAIPIECEGDAFDDGYDHCPFCIAAAD